MSKARYHVLHETEYPPCGQPVALARHLLHLVPRRLPYQQPRNARITVSPGEARLVESMDAFGNPVASLSLEAPHDGLLVRAESEIAVQSREIAPDEESTPWDEVRDSLRYHAAPLSPAELEALRFCFASPQVPLLADCAEFAADCFAPGTPVFAGARALMEKIFETFTFDADATEVDTSVAEVLTRKRGVCQDFAHLMIACLRALGLPARYMSGYLLTDPPPGSPRLVGADASHAWVAAWCPRLGWAEFDPTNGIQPDLRHITLGWGRDFHDVSPLRGVILGGRAQPPEVRVTVTPLA